jgi:long-chain acyl-CoA synthetase
MPAVTTINDAFALASSRGATTAMLWQDPAGVWQPISSAELYGRVRALAGAFASWGVVKGDRIAIISENRWEWPVTDFAALALGAVDAPLYSTLTPEQVGYMLNDCGAKIVVVSSKEQYEKVLAAGELPALKHIIIMDSVDLPEAEKFSTLLAHAPAMQQRDSAFDAQVKSVQPEDLATIIYTSGTTGQSKGVMLTHGNLACNFTVSTKPFGFDTTDRLISFLPLSHVMARHLDYGLMCDGATIAYCAKFDALPAAMNAIHPTIFVAVPRVYEKIRQAVEGKSAASPVKSRILSWALGVGKKHRQETLQGKQPGGLAWKLADKLVFSKIREAFGGSVKTFVSGSAPLGMDTAGWFADAGIRIFEGYGLTETSPVVSLNYPNAHRIGTIGRAIERVEARIAADGEIEVHGPAVFQGYWQKPQETADVFTPDGWFKTGDIGNIDADGYLSITDRKKEIMKTSGGKMIAPQPIEGKLKAHTLVAHAALVGDNHKFACVLISPNFVALESWAKEQGIAASDRAELVKHTKVLAEYQAIVDKVNATLAHFEDMKRFAVVPHEWSIEDGDLTPTMKLKRRLVEKKYASEIAAFYKDEATASR